MRIDKRILINVKTLGIKLLSLSNIDKFPISSHAGFAKDVTKVK